MSTRKLDQSTLDALADAETLWLAACDFAGGLNSLHDDLKVAGTWGRRAARDMAIGADATGRRIRGDWWTSPELAAHAAFRAVPALRGDR